jgi:hypothetical protein
MEHFELRVDSAHRRLDIVQRGFWTDAIFDRFEAAFGAALRELHGAGGCLTALVDATAFSVQSREILLRFKALLHEQATLCARGTAVLVPAELNRLQAQLSGQAIRIQTFTVRADAEAWLAKVGASEPVRQAVQG